MEEWKQSYTVPAGHSATHRQGPPAAPGRRRPRALPQLSPSEERRGPLGRLGAAAAHDKCHDFVSPFSTRGLEVDCHEAAAAAARARLCGMVRDDDRPLQPQ